MDNDPYDVKYVDKRGREVVERLEGYHILTPATGEKAMINVMLKGLNSMERKIVGLKIAGFSYTVIGRDLGLHMKRVERIFKVAKKKVLKNHMSKSVK